ncbi:hypothetical protein SynRS9902_00671 [Synechococcus sp. RS9902]|nr:hypothetical protein SynRS9902_00671 [Synechococcus sp. RS9902]
MIAAKSAIAPALSLENTDLQQGGFTLLLLLGSGMGIMWHPLRLGPAQDRLLQRAFGHG